MIGAFNLAETDTISSCSQDETAYLVFGLEIFFRHLMDAINDERLPRGAIKPSTAIMDFCDAKKDHPTDRHLRDEIVPLVITQLIQSSSHTDVVCHLDIAAGFRDIGYVSNRHLS